MPFEGFVTIRPIKTKKDKDIFNVKAALIC